MAGTRGMEKDKRDEKRLAIITGAGSGIGSAVAIGLAKDGYRVVLIGRKKEPLHEVYATIKDTHEEIPDPILLPIDITDYEHVGIEITRINKKYGDINILVNSAAIFMDGSLNASISEYRNIVETNLIAQYAILQKVVEIMKGQRKGYIFNMASRAGTYGFPGGGIYGSTKFGLIGLGESLYRELAPQGIRVTSLCPGWVNTEMAREAGTPLSNDEMIQPDDLLKTIRYVLSLSPSVCIREVILEMANSIV